MDEKISSIVKEAIRNRVFPGCVVGYIRDDNRSNLAFGALTYDDGADVVTTKTIYDVASITKSIPTASVALHLIENGELDLDDKVIKYVPELDNQYRDDVTIWHLLTYTAVFDIPGGLSKMAETHPNDLIDQLVKSPLLAPPGEKYFYTNAPAILLGLVVERLTGKRLDVLGDQLFFGPLGMADTTFHPKGFSRIAPSEIIGDKEIRGIVHDEAARVLAERGQVVGNAGLFSTVEDLLQFGAMLIGHGSLHGKRYFEEKTVRQMHENQLSQIGQSAALGWELDQPKFMGDKGSDEIFGKTGFTGCAIIIDPKKEVVLVHLSNRNYPSRPDSRDPINAFRQELADLVFGP